MAKRNVQTISVTSLILADCRVGCGGGYVNDYFPGPVPPGQGTPPGHCRPGVASGPLPPGWTEKIAMRERIVDRAGVLLQLARADGRDRGDHA